MPRPQTPSNPDKIKAFVARQIEAAETAQDHNIIRNGVAYIERQISTLAAWADTDDDEPAPDHLQGVTVWDLTRAQGLLLAAEGRMAVALGRPVGRG